jgi:hypothetical protein
MGFPSARPILIADFVEEFFIGFSPEPNFVTSHLPPSTSTWVLDDQKNHRCNTGSGKTATEAGLYLGREREPQTIPSEDSGLARQKQASTICPTAPGKVTN